MALHSAKLDVFQDLDKSDYDYRNYLNKEAKSCHEIVAKPRSDMDSAKTSQSSAVVTVLSKTRIRMLRRKVDEVLTERKKSGDKHININPDYLLCNSVEKQLKENVVIRTDIKKDLKTTSNKDLSLEEHNACKSSVKTLSTTVSDDLNAEIINRKEVLNLEDIGDFTESVDKTDVSVNSICCDNIFCDCNSCKALRDTSPTAKLKPNRKYKYKFVCSICNKIFHKKCSLARHKASNCDTLKLFSCNYCAQGFTTSEYLKYHISKCHTTSLSEKKLKLKLSCNLCDNTFSCKTNLERHKRNVHFLQKMNLTYSCEICQKVYKNKRGLDCHKVKSHGNNKFECGHCSKMYNNKSVLSIHIHSVHLWKFKKCKECSKEFQTASGLKKHESHVHFKSFDPHLICESCGKGFLDKNRLQNHVLIHTGEKPYMCQVCGKSFRTDTNLGQHSRTHSDERPYSCDLCAKTFRMKHHLRQHMAVHGMVHPSVRRKQRTN